MWGCHAGVTRLKGGGNPVVICPGSSSPPASPGETSALGRDLAKLSHGISPGAGPGPGTSPGRAQWELCPGRSAPGPPSLELWGQTLPMASGKPAQRGARRAVRVVISPSCCAHLFTRVRRRQFNRCN